MTRFVPRKFSAALAPLLIGFNGKVRPYLKMSV